MESAEYFPHTPPEDYEWKEPKIDKQELFLKVEILALEQSIENWQKIELHNHKKPSVNFLSKIRSILSF